MIEVAFAIALDAQQIKKQCIYQAGVARSVQEIRQEGESWEDFKLQTDKIYQDDEGYKNILSIAHMVYDKIPVQVDSGEVFQGVYDMCITSHYRKHKKGPEFDV